MTIEALAFEHRPRNSIANNLDKINELVDWVNQDTHLYASATGERVTVDDASSLKGLTVDGRSVQDGTPTPDAPVAVQVMGGRNLLDPDTAIPNPTTVRNGITITKDADGWFNVSGASTSSTAFVIPIYGASESDVIFEDETYTLSVEDNVVSTNTLRVQIFNGVGMTNPTITTSNGYLTVSSVVRQVRLFIPAAAQGVTINGRFRLQLEKGSTATPYTPYGSIGIVVGNTATSIDLQGNKLASLPDGTHDELHVDSAGRVWIEKRVRHTTQAVTDGVTGTVGTDVLSSTGQIADGADVWYKLASSQTIDLGYIAPPAIPSGSVVTVYASLTPTIRLEWWIDDGITELVNDLIAYIDYKTEG